MKLKSSQLKLENMKLLGDQKKMQDRIDELEEQAERDKWTIKNL